MGRDDTTWVDADIRKWSAGGTVRSDSGHFEFVSLSFDLATVRGALADDLPAHLVPSGLVPHPRLPLTPQGKIDKAVLAAEVLSEHVQDVALTANERAAATLYQAALGGVKERLTRAGPESSAWAPGHGFGRSGRG